MCDDAHLFQPSASAIMIHPKVWLVLTTLLLWPNVLLVLQVLPKQFVPAVKPRTSSLEACQGDSLQKRLCSHLFSEGNMRHCYREVSVPSALWVVNICADSYKPVHSSNVLVHRWFTKYFTLFAVLSTDVYPSWVFWFFHFFSYESLTFWIHPSDIYFRTLCLLLSEFSFFFRYGQKCGNI